MAFEIKLYKDNFFMNKLKFNNETTVEAIFESQDLDFNEYIAARLNNDYAKLGDKVNKDANLFFLTMNSTEGFRIHQVTIIFIVMKAFHKISKNQAKLVVEHSIGDGIYCESFGKYNLTIKKVEALKQVIKEFIAAEKPIEKINMSGEEIKKIFSETNRDDIFKNLKHEGMWLYKCNNFYDYFIRQLAENTKYIKDFNIIFFAPGIVIQFPEKGKHKIEHKFKLQKKLFKTHQEHDKWLNIIGLHNTSALNRAIDNYTITRKIQIEEALHEKKIVKIAESISRNRNLKLILIAGPSSSGKTTFAKRLEIQLRVIGLYPKIISLDDYFVSRDKTPRKENGDFDYESIYAIDLELLNLHLSEILAGKAIELPKYNFITGASEPSHKKLQLHKNEILILEGIHGLNDLLTPAVPFYQKTKIYVSALNNLNIDSHNRIPTTDSRKFRRIVRDNKFRGHTVEQTLKMWDSVRDGENHNIFPFQEEADFSFNSTLTYEMGVLKKYVTPLLQNVSKYCDVYVESRRLLKIFQHISHIEDEKVPSNSILREFIGGSIFKY